MAKILETANELNSRAAVRYMLGVTSESLYKACEGADLEVEVTNVIKTVEESARFGESVRYYVECADGALYSTGSGRIGEGLLGVCEYAQGASVKVRISSVISKNGQRYKQAEAL